MYLFNKTGHRYFTVYLLHNRVKRPWFKFTNIKSGGPKLYIRNLQVCIFRLCFWYQRGHDTLQVLSREARLRYLLK